MRHKDEVFPCFKKFYALVQNQFNVQIQAIRTDNGTEYVNKIFGAFMSEQGILHQTSCPDTPQQNGVAERKNRHILEVARALMFTMNVPKFLWSEAVLTATYLINRTPLRVTGMKSPCELILKDNTFVVPPKLFRCTCFALSEQTGSSSSEMYFSRVFFWTKRLQVLEPFRTKDICEHGCHFSGI
jgi:transposase InsO family protein